MKKKLLLIASLLSFQIGFTQVFDVETIQSSGDNDKRINMVLLGDGYQVGELDQFETDARAFMDAFFLLSPYKEYENYFNVHIINVISNESGASHPGTATNEHLYDVPIATVDNFFGTAYDSFSNHILLYTPNTALISDVLADNFPTHDIALILVNSEYYGGSGGQFPMASTGEFSADVAIHEMGHSFVNLQDEYWAGPTFALEGINMTQDNDPITIRWKNWLGTGDVGIFSHGDSGIPATWFKPHLNCKMIRVDFDFCNVCQEGIIEKIHSVVSPIDSYTPSISIINSPVFPLDFQLSLIRTIPNTLESTWTLNSNPFETDMDAVTVLESDVNVGTNNLTVVVHDGTSQLDVDNHDTIHFYTVSWTIDTTLGIQDIEANDFSISMYPNPSNNIVNFTMVNTLGKDVTIEIISMEGKKIKSVNISNNENAQIDISALSQGIYITNFYANNVLISSKKLVKN